MNESKLDLAPDLSLAQSRQWIGRLLIAVVLGIAIWNFVASLITAVILPGLARIMEADPQSPLYLGKGDFNFPAFFTAVLELCLALIAALVVNSWSERRPQMVRRKMPAAASATTSILSTPVAPARVAQAPMAPAIIQEAAQPVAPAAPVSAPSTPPAPAVKPAEPEKPKNKKPKAVYYNSVGEPVEDDE